MKEVTRYYPLSYRRIQLSIFAILFLFLLPVTSSSQLISPDKTELFRDDVVPRIDIIIDEMSLDFILDPVNSSSNELFEATFIFSNGTVLDTLENIGFRLRGNTSRNADKKSFKVNLNAFVPGRKYYGVQKINLNGQHNDPTSARAKICADLADQLHIPSLRTNHVQLYINNEYFGLYTNVEHIDQNYVKKRFGNKNGNLYKCLYPADLNYKGDNPDSYKEVIYGRRNYDLKNNIEKDDYSDFANFVKILNITPDADLACELEKVFNVDQYLRTIVLDILTGNWDGPIYNKNNFYLYHNQHTGQFEYIPYDLDNTMGIDWVNRDWGTRNIYTWSRTGETRPIYNRLMQNKEYKDRFTYYMLETLRHIYDEEVMYPYLDQMRDRLKPYLENDLYYTYDYGFNIDDFVNGFEYKLPYQQTDYGIKEFIQTRRIEAFTQIELADVPPIITEVQYNHPNEIENLIVKARVIDDLGLNAVEFCISIDGDPPICEQMFESGETELELEDDMYGVIFPPFFELLKVDFYIRATDEFGNISRYPRCSDIEIQNEEEELSLSINEFMASNATTIADIKGEFDDWIELHNYGSTPIYLGDKYLSDNPDNRDKWTMPNYTIAPGEYLLFWADDDRNQGTFHTNFKLSKAGEYIGIFDDDASGNALIDEIEFDMQETDISRGRLPNGTGEFVTLNPSPGLPNLTTNVQDIASKKDLIDIYPNPTTQNISYRCADCKIIDISIVDVFGNTVTVKTSRKNTIFLPEIPGIYFIIFLKEDGSTAVKKIIRL
ncbi:MAG: CotH kinase family protein [Saprospiraceae bacterium]|nr:CotH kinase family protein [Saprospiraceae bacterium]